MRGDRLGDVGFAKIGFLLAELLELRFAIAHQILRIATHQVDQLLDFGHARRLLEILPDRGFYSLAAQKLEGLPRLAAARVVPDRDGHSDPFSMPPPSYPRFGELVVHSRSFRQFPPISASPSGANRPPADTPKRLISLMNRARWIPARDFRYFRYFRRTFLVRPSDSAGLPTLLALLHAPARRARSSAASELPLPSNHRRD